jgi:hypothetical protein
MPLPRRAFLAAAPALALAACGTQGASQAAQDARLIVSAITPVANSAASLGAAPDLVTVINRSLATATGEAGTLGTQYAPSLLDTQAFFLAISTLLQALGSITNLPPSGRNIVDAATSLLPTFTVILGPPSVAPPPKMPADQARLILRGTQYGVATPNPAPSPPALSPSVAAPAVPVPTPAPASPPRFHLTADDVGGGQVRYSFYDGGQVIESGVAPSFSVLEARFAVFKAQRQQLKP